MSSEWSSAKLSEITTKIGSGQTPRGGKDAYKGGDYALIRSQNIYNYGFSAGGLAYIDQTQAEELSSVEVRPGDVLLNITGDSVARCCGVPQWVIPARVNQHVCILRSDPACLDSGFLRYYLVTPSCQGRLLALASGGATRNALTKGMLDSFEITFPPLPEQKEIAHILGTLDEKIELNHKTNETLEAMAKALFKSWFVDFDPVRAKAEGRPTGLPAEISDLFPDSFDDSELGVIPSGWSVQSAGSQYQVSIGKTPPRKESKWFSTSAADMPWLSIRDLGEIGVYADRASEYLTRDAVEKFNIRVVPAGTVVLSFKLTIGRVAITGSEMLTNEAIAHFSPLEKRAGSEYTCCLLSQYDYHSLGSTSSIATAVNSQMLRDMPLVVPPETIARSFCDATTSIFSSIKCGQRETYCLSDFRDALLPKLISGEIRIPDAEKVLEEVGV